MMRAELHTTPPPPQCGSVTPQPSPEFRRFTAARQAYEECIWARDEKGAAVASDLIDHAIVSLIKRPVTSLRDILDLAEMVAAERWTTDENGLPDEQFCNDHPLDIDRALLRALIGYGRTL